MFDFKSYFEITKNTKKDEILIINILENTIFQ